MEFYPGSQNIFPSEHKSLGTRVDENQSIRIQLMMLKNDTVLVKNIYLIS